MVLAPSVGNAANPAYPHGLIVSTNNPAVIGCNLFNDNFPTGATQISGPFIQIAPNVCGGDLVCP